MIYRETYQDTQDHKQKYFSDIESFIESEMKKAELHRKECVKDIELFKATLIVKILLILG